MSEKSPLGSKVGSKYRYPKSRLRDCDVQRSRATAAAGKAAGVVLSSVDVATFPPPRPHAQRPRLAAGAFRGDDRLPALPAGARLDGEPPPRREKPLPARR
jgi:hypothetical protein